MARQFNEDDMVVLSEAELEDLKATGRELYLQTYSYKGGEEKIRVVEKYILSNGAERERTIMKGMPEEELLDMCKDIQKICRKINKEKLNQNVG